VRHPLTADGRAAAAVHSCGYLRTLDRHRFATQRYTPQLGRRFRALKLWIQLRWFGLEGLRQRIERHLAMATELAATIDAEPDWELMAPVPFSTVCFRWRPAELARRADAPEVAEVIDAANTAIMDAVNRTGEVFLSHTRLAGRFAIRVAVGNLRTEAKHVGPGAAPGRGRRAGGGRPMSTDRPRDVHIPRRSTWAPVTSSSTAMRRSSRRSAAAALASRPARPSSISRRPRSS
jgi:hypothetical protein